MMHSSLRECFRRAKLIGDEEDEVSLQQYSDRLLRKYIEEQIRYFPNDMRTINSYIVTAGIVLDNAIVKNEISMGDMPTVQYLILARSLVTGMIRNCEMYKKRAIDAAFMELGETQTYNSVPSKEQLLASSIQHHCNWDH